MITGNIKSQIDQIWNAFWSGGISNPLEVIEQITYLLFLSGSTTCTRWRRTRPPGSRSRWSAASSPRATTPRAAPTTICAGRASSTSQPSDMYAVVGDHVFPFLRTLGGDDSTYAHHMKDARFTIPTPALLAKVVDLIDDVPMEDRDTKGDLYEYMLGKIATAGQNGQFRTPRHIIQLMVELTAPQPTDIICDPACGTAGFLVAAGEYLREHHPDILHDAKLREHFHHRMFHGFDFDNTMLRIGSMNMLLHGVENPDIRYRDSLAQDHAGEEEKYTLVLANPPFAGSARLREQRQGPAADRQDQEDRTALPGALPAPAQARRPRRGHRARRRAVRLVQRAQDAAPHARRGPEARRRGLAARRRVQALRRRLHRDPALHQDQLRRHRPGLVLRRGGRRLEPRRQAHAAAAGRQARPRSDARRSPPKNTRKNNLPDVLARWTERDGAERERPRTAQSFCVPKADIAAQGYDLSLNRYKEVVHEESSTERRRRSSPTSRSWRRRSSGG